MRISILLGLIAAVQGQRRQLRHEDGGPTNPIWNHLLDVNSAEQDRQHATPLFWHIHKAGGTTLHDYFGSCLNLTIAAEVGIKGHEHDQVCREGMCTSRLSLPLANTSQHHRLLSN